MPTYLVSYDLNNPPKNPDYHPLIKRIRDDWRGQKVLYSEWIVRTQTTKAQELREDLVRYIDSNDGLLVVGLTGEAAWTGGTLKITDSGLKDLLTAA
jgi:hypothetical protein